MEIKISFDWHGVIDADPAFFLSQALKILEVRGEVYIVTGQSWNPTVEKQFLQYGRGKRWWTHYFSIDDYLFYVKKQPYCFDEKGRHHFEDEIWNAVKAEYCAQQQITLHVDNELKYVNSFTTPYFLYNGPQDNLALKQKIEVLLDKTHF